MLKLGAQNINGLYLGEQEIKKAYLGSELIFESTPAIKTMSVLVSGTAVATLLSSGTLMVAGTRIMSASPTDVTTEGSLVEISYSLQRAISIARTVTVNGENIGHVKASGDSVSTTIPAQDGMEISVVFSNYAS